MLGPLQADTPGPLSRPVSLLGQLLGAAFRAQLGLLGGALPSHGLNPAHLMAITRLMVPRPGKDLDDLCGVSGDRLFGAPACFALCWHSRHWVQGSGMNRHGYAASLAHLGARGSASRQRQG